MRARARTRAKVRRKHVSRSWLSDKLDLSSSSVLASQSRSESKSDLTSKRDRIEGSSKKAKVVPPLLMLLQTSCCKLAEATNFMQFIQLVVELKHPSLALQNTYKRKSCARFRLKVSMIEQLRLQKKVSQKKRKQLQIVVHRNKLSLNF